MAESTRQGVLFPELLDRPVKAAFDEPATTSDGGALLLKALDDSLGVTEALAESCEDRRASARVQHSLHDLFRQRVYGIALGYEDCNDAGRVGNDPMQKLLVGRDPRTGDSLASQPTLSRFENTVSATDLMRMGNALANAVVERHRRRLRSKKVRRITIDLDATVDPTHGHQQGCLFSGFYRTWCYLPLLGFLSFNDEVDHYLFAALLRPGLASGKTGTLGVLRRIIPRIRQAFPRARIRVRLDAGFASAELFELLESYPFRVDYLVGIGKNSVLEARSACLQGWARRQCRAQKETVTHYGDTWYSARTWKGRERRVIFKAEALQYWGREIKDNPRYVVTNLAGSPARLYHAYVHRGETENRIKEAKALQIDRTSCSRFLANQFRVLLTAAACVLFQELRWRARGTDAARAQITTLQLRLLKIAARVERSVRRFVLHLAENHPWAELWRRVALRCSAVST